MIAARDIRVELVSTLAGADLADEALIAAIEECNARFAAATAPGAIEVATQERAVLQRTRSHLRRRRRELLAAEQPLAPTPPSAETRSHEA